jgi:hypothetical protein
MPRNGSRIRAYSASPSFGELASRIVPEPFPGHEAENGRTLSSIASNVHPSAVTAATTFVERR